MSYTIPSVQAYPVTDTLSHIEHAVTARTLLSPEEDTTGTVSHAPASAPLHHTPDENPTGSPVVQNNARISRLFITNPDIEAQEQEQELPLPSPAPEQPRSFRSLVFRGGWDTKAPGTQTRGLVEKLKRFSGPPA